MYSLINSSFNRTYNPDGKNLLTDIKRLLTARDTVAQHRACGYLIATFNRYNENSNESAHLVKYLLDNDIIVFLCEAASNLDLSLFRLVLSCVRFLWHNRCFYADDDAARVMATVLRALAHYAGSESHAAVDICLNFLYDLLHGISIHETTPALSYQSAYNTEQLLACLNTLIPHFNTNSTEILSSALVLHALISYQPDDLCIKGSTTKDLVTVLNKWLNSLLKILNHSILVESVNWVAGYNVICQLGFDSLRLSKLLHTDKSKAPLVQNIVTDNQEIRILQESVIELKNLVQHVLTELVIYTKENQQQIDTKEYSIFLKFLLQFLHDCSPTENLLNFCDMLYSKGYLTILPQIQVNRDNATVRTASTLILGEMLRVLAGKYLTINNAETSVESYAKDINMGLVELRYGLEKPEIIGPQLQKNQAYSLLIYIYFYCQCHENPEEATAPLLPYLVEHILSIPESFRPPPYIIKALWLVYAMSSISNNTMNSLDERINLEKSIDRLIAMLHPEPSNYYTHNPAILLWSFTSQRISYSIRITILSQWFITEENVPSELMNESEIWKLLLNIVIHNRHQVVIQNCMKALYIYLDEADFDAREEVSSQVWSTLPEMLSMFLIDQNDIETESSVCYLLNLATTLLPQELDQNIYLKVAELVTVLFIKNNPERLTDDMESKYNYLYVCLKLCIRLFERSTNFNVNRVLLAYVNRAGFLQRVLLSTESLNDRVSCTALQLLSNIVHSFNKNNYEPNSIVQVQTHSIVRSLRQDCTSERGASLLQLVYMILDSGLSTPLVLSYDLGVEPSTTQQYNALRALMFRIQMTCCGESTSQTSAGWRTLSSIFKHAILAKNNLQLVATLTSQPWTHTLICYQFTQSATQEFLIFILNWLSLLKITIMNCQEYKKSPLSKQNLVCRTTATVRLIKKNLILQDDDFKEVKLRIVTIVREILEDF